MPPNTKVNNTWYRIALDEEKRNPAAPKPAPETKFPVHLSPDNYAPQNHAKVTAWLERQPR